MNTTDAKIRAEWEKLRTVAMHKAGVELIHENRHANQSHDIDTSYQTDAIQEYELLERVLKHEFRINVVRLRDTIVEAAERDSVIYDKLVRAAEEVTGVIDSEKNERSPDANHYFEVLLLNSQIGVTSKGESKANHPDTSEDQPLSEICYMRDQQAVTDKGIVLSRMGTPQRRGEPAITKIMWNALGAEIVHEVTEPGIFEGGDFIPLKDFALIGIGDRTNKAGVEQLLKYGVGFDEVGVVHQPSHPLIPDDDDNLMRDMHLDNYFNIASKGVAVGLKPLLESAQVDIYTRVAPGEYEKEEKCTDLLSYIKCWGFDVVGLTTLEQLSYASSFLTIKDGTILAVDIERNIKETLYTLQSKAKDDPERYGALLSEVEKNYEFLKNKSEFFPHKKEMYQHGIDAYPIVLRNHIGGYGITHSMTAALERR